MGGADRPTGASGSGVGLGPLRHGTDASEASHATEPRQELQEPREDGDLFLTCLRLRFEERGSWTQALASPADGARDATPPPPRPGSPYVSPRREAAEEALPPDRDTPPLASPPASPPEARRSWREWAGLPPKGSTRALARRLLKGESWRSSQAAALRPAFGRAGRGLELLPAEGGGGWEHLAVAARKDGAKDHTLALTSAPLLPAEPKCGSDCVLQTFYFELEVLGTSPGTARTCSLGFAWMPPEGALPAVASEMPQALIVGGEPLRAHLGGKDLGKVAGWRPAVHIVEGSVVGALLEVRAAAGPLPDAPATSLRLLVLQDGEVRAEVRAALGGVDWAPSSEHTPHGVVDVAGNVRRVRLRPAVPPPAAVAAAAATARGAAQSRVGGS
uniref:Uncharacterized protein n=1 Tax=Alexandrium monilatum TaxID=311494 RepID=A0A7S4SEK6_9DINO|mmetsp:Transcript_1911/g.6330  ORF Transcript_1911/g.6330 Transcript_1911/m.6330 type:complete len:389 (-) Transcript_1911:57-1223(-)